MERISTNQSRSSLVMADGSVCVGAGLVALDVIVNGSPSTPAKLCAGGTCGNVLSNLSYLGWKSKPIARLDDNTASDNLFQDLLQFNVETSLISRSKDGSTPIIIHRILKDKDGKPKHKFEFKLPGTNTWLPRYKPVLKLSVEHLLKNQPSANVFFFDRISPSTLLLAKHYKERGALIVFEPSSLKPEDRLFMDSLSIANVVKFSGERISNYSDIFPKALVDLEIETLGKDGLKFRLKKASNDSWETVPPYKVDDVIDSAGAGDWCTAGIIHELGQGGFDSFNKKESSEIIEVLRVGQALGALNCLFFGARGLSYNLSYDSMIKSVQSILNREQLSINLDNESTKMVTIEGFQFETLF